MGLENTQIKAAFFDGFPKATKDCTIPHYNSSAPQARNCTIQLKNTITELNHTTAQNTWTCRASHITVNHYMRLYSMTWNCTALRETVHHYMKLYSITWNYTAPPENFIAPGNCCLQVCSLQPRRSPSPLPRPAQGASSSPNLLPSWLPAFLSSWLTPFQDILIQIVAHTDLIWL